MPRSTIKKIGFFIVLIISLGFIAFPFYWAVVSSLKPTSEIFRSPPTFVPAHITFGNYKKLLTQTNFLRYYLNSIIVAGIASLSSIIIATLAGYSLTRFKYWGRNYLIRSFLLVYMFPPVLLVIPYFIFFRRLGLTNTYLSLITSYVSFALPFAIWMMWSFFRTVPIDLEEAAMVDGATRMGAFIRVIVPLALPGIIAVGIFTFLVAWNDYLYAVTLISKPALKTLPVGVSLFFEATATQWGNLMAASVLITLPLVIVFSLVQSYLIRGFAGGAIKG